MKKLLLTAVIVLTPSFALAQGSGHNDCEYYSHATADRPDCTGSNPFYVAPSSGAPANATNAILAAPTRALHHKRSSASSGRHDGSQR